VRNNHSLDFSHLKERTIQTGHATEEEFTREHFLALLKKRIKQTNIEMVKADILPFIKNHEDLSIWSTDYFTQLADMITFE
jgi:hypothetical protein